MGEYVTTEVSPGTDSSPAVVVGPNDPCESQDTCSECLSAEGRGDCKWTAGSCRSVCLMDAPCFELRFDDETPQFVCAVADIPKPIPEGAARIPEETGWISPEDATPVADSIPEGAVPVPDVPPPLADSIPEGAVPVVPEESARLGALPEVTIESPSGVSVNMKKAMEGAVPVPYVQPPLEDPVPEGAVPVVPEESASLDEADAVPEVSFESPSGISSNMKIAMENIRGSTASSGSTASATLVFDEVEDEHSGSAARTLIAASAVLGLATVIMSVQ